MKAFCTKQHRAWKDDELERGTGGADRGEASRPLDSPFSMTDRGKVTAAAFSLLEYLDYFEVE